MIKDTVSAVIDFARVVEMIADARALLIGAPWDDVRGAKVDIAEDHLRKAQELLTELGAKT